MALKFNAKSNFEIETQEEECGVKYSSSLNMKTASARPCPTLAILLAAASLSSLITG
ncbi:Hypothetical predicted protein, partial [Scomber scombrus]